MICLFDEVITDSKILQKRYVNRNGYVFTSIDYPANVYDAIVIKEPVDITCFSSQIEGSLHSLEKQIDFINEQEIEKALIIADRIDFITKCPTLKHLRIIPGDSIGNGFDYSPLYAVSGLKSLQCLTSYGIRDEFSTTIDYSHMENIEDVQINGLGHKNYTRIKTLKSLAISEYQESDLLNLFESSILDTLTLTRCKIKSLDGLQNSERMQCLYLYYNRSLHDITALKKVKKTLKALRIENCPQINDFSVLAELENLELLQLTGNNKLMNLDFLNNMKNLKTFVFNMDVLDGDLSPCLDLSYVYSERNRKHYNLKDSDLPKGEYVRGNETIETWRRLE